VSRLSLSACALVCMSAGCAGPPRLVAPLRAPSSLSEVPDAPFRASPPAATAVAEVAGDVPHEVTLANGLRIVVVERHAYPVVATKLIIGRSSLDLDDGGGVRVAETSFLYRVVGDATLRKQLQRTAAETGVSLGDSSGPDYVAWHSKGPASNFETSCDFLFKATFGARLTPAEYKQRSALWRRAAHEGRLSLGAAVRSILFGDRHPYGDSEVARTPLSLDQAESTHQQLFQPNLATLLVVGDVTAERAIAEGTRVFGGIASAPGALAREYEAAPFQNGPKLAVVSHRGMEHRAGAIFARGPANGTPDQDAFGLLASVLGGFGSRINKQVREDMGASYGVSSPVLHGRAATWLSIDGSYDGDKAVAGIRAELDEIRRIQAGDLSEADIETGRARLVGELRGWLSTVDGAGALYMNAIVLGEPLERVRDLPQRLARIGKDDVARVARAYLAPERLHVVFLGEDRWLDTDSLEMGALKTLKLPQ
jgi:zinc protease